MRLGAWNNIMKSINSKDQTEILSKTEHYEDCPEQVGR